MFSFSCSFLVENATKTLRETLFLETNEETASKNRAEAETKLVYFNDGCAVKREIWVSPRRTREERDRRHRCGVQPGGFRRETIKSEAHASLLTATLAPARLLISNPLALSQYQLNTDFRRELIIRPTKNMNGRQLRLERAKFCKRTGSAPRLS